MDSGVRRAGGRESGRGGGERGAGASRLYRTSRQSFRPTFGTPPLAGCKLCAPRVHNQSADSALALTLLVPSPSSTPFASVLFAPAAADARESLEYLLAHDAR